MVKEVKTKLYDYNIDAIYSNGKTVDGTDFNYLLSATVDFYNEANLDAMIEFAEDEDDSYYNSQKDIIVTLNDDIEEIIIDSLNDKGIYLEEMKENFLGKIIAYALGYINFNK